jgi:uncharacterized Zn finger protein (UPF0148 family)
METKETKIKHCKRCGVPIVGIRAAFRTKFCVSCGHEIQAERARRISRKKYRGIHKRQHIDFASHKRYVRMIKGYLRETNY